MRNIGLLGRWGTYACPQCLPSDIVRIRSWARTLRRPGIRHRHLPYHTTIPCSDIHTESGFWGLSLRDASGMFWFQSDQSNTTLCSTFNHILFKMCSIKCHAPLGPTLTHLYLHYIQFSSVQCHTHTQTHTHTHTQARVRPLRLQACHSPQRVLAAASLLVRPVGCR